MFVRYHILVSLYTADLFVHCTSFVSVLYELLNVIGTCLSTPSYPGCVVMSELLFLIWYL